VLACEIYVFWKEEKLGLGLGSGGFRVRWPGMRFRFGCWHVRLRFSGRRRN
jgi:hypothetical protein